MKPPPRALGKGQTSSDRSSPLEPHPAHLQHFIQIVKTMNPKSTTPQQLANIFPCNQTMATFSFLETSQKKKHRRHPWRQFERKHMIDGNCTEHRFDQSQPPSHKCSICEDRVNHYTSDTKSKHSSPADVSTPYYYLISERCVGMLSILHQEAGI